MVIHPKLIAKYEQIQQGNLLIHPMTPGFQGVTTMHLLYIVPPVTYFEMTTPERSMPTTEERAFVKPPEFPGVV